MFQVSFQVFFRRLQTLQIVQCQALHFDRVRMIPTAIAPLPAPKMKNGVAGKPGINPNKTKIIEVTAKALG